MGNNTELTVEQSFLIKTLSDFVNKRKTEVPAEIDISEFKKIADRHQLSAVVSYQTDLPSMQSALLAASYYASMRQSLMEQIDIAFHENGIQYLVFKGAEIAKYYNEPSLRTYGDIDLLVHRDDKERAGAIIEKLGFPRPKIIATEHEWIYNQDNFEIELHHALLYDDDNCSGDILRFVDTVWEHAVSENGICYHLELEYHFVFTLLHLYKHFLWDGIGIRQFLDVALIIKNSTMDYDKIEIYLEQCGISKFAKVSFAFIEHWFGICCQIKSSAISDDLYLSSTSSILSGGVFGNNSNWVLNSMCKHGKYSFMISYIFPSWEQLKYKYPKIGKNIILYPLLWFMRIIETLLERKKLQKFTFAVKQLLFGKQKDERETFLQKWGL